MKYKLRFTDVCDYEVTAENEEEALTKPVPDTNHRASIDVVHGDLPDKPSDGKKEIENAVYIVNDTLTHTDFGPMVSKSWKVLKSALSRLEEEL